MEKNRLLLNQKKYLSFSNYKKIINSSKRNPKELKLLLITNSPSINIIFNNNKHKYLNRNNSNNSNNVPNLLHPNNSNKLCSNNKSVKLFSINKIIPKINLSKIPNLKNENKIIKYKIKKNIEDKIEHGNEILLDNLYQKFRNKRLEDKKIFNKTNFRYSMNCSARAKNSQLNLVENKKENNEECIKILQSSNAFISSRKINKELFGNGIYKIIKEHKGRKKCKFIIIGKLKTEPNFN